jgi:putative heme-binding domain-containing protein
MINTLRPHFAASLLIVCVRAPALFAGSASTLQDRLAAEPIAVLAKAARERGDAARGAVLFFQPFLTCAKCHDGDAGTQLGPDIAKLGTDGTPEHLIESVLHPSKAIKKGYDSVVIHTADGRTYTGLIADESNGVLTLIDPAAGGKRVLLAAADIEKRVTSERSLMPDGLANLLSDRQQFLDLMKYLIEIAEQGPARAKQLRPIQVALTIPEYEKSIDHAGLIGSITTPCGAANHSTPAYALIVTAREKRPGRCRIPRVSRAARSRTAATRTAFIRP